ncbi:MAG TPA: phytoene/squalene synthase family protein [Beijerinckiaceae bacterium]
MPPFWPEPGLASAADLAACRSLIRDGSRSFHAASVLLPSRVRDAAHGLYGFCRLADDAVDRHGAGPEVLDRLHARLDQIYARRPADSAADRAFADVVAAFGVPQTLPMALLEGFAWDAEGRRYRTLDDLMDYAARVAGTVGAMMTLLMGVRDAAALARACDLGVAMQLTNIARDVAEDARQGRLYLPLAWLEEAGLDAEAWLADPQPSPALFGVVARLLAVADGLYARAEGGIALLPSGCRPAILAARLIYAEIGRSVERGGAVGLSTRAVVPARRKVELMARAFGIAPWLARPSSSPPLAATQFLVEAGLSAAPVPPRRDPGLSARALWVFELFDRLGRRAEA